MIEMTMTCMMSSAVEMHVTRSKTSAKSESAWSKHDVMRTMIIMVPTMTNFTDNTPQREGVIQEESKLFPRLEQVALVSCPKISNFGMWLKVTKFQNFFLIE
jgi:hypothetical protein